MQTLRSSLFAATFHPTARVVGIDVSPRGTITGHCRLRGHASTVPAAAAAAVRVQLANASLTVDGAVLVLRERFLPHEVASAGAEDAASQLLMRWYQAARDHWQNQTSAALAGKGLGTVKQLKALSSASRAMHAQRIEEEETAAAAAAIADGVSSSAAAAAIAAAAHSDNLFAGVDADIGRDPHAKAKVARLPTRSKIKPPFWQPCNTDHLRDVLRRVFP